MVSILSQLEYGLKVRSNPNGVMVSILSWLEYGLKVKTKTVKLVCVDSPLSICMNHQGIWANNGWLGIKIMCQECSDMSTCGLLVQLASYNIPVASTMKIPLIMLV
jgi:hypothetical protein